MLVDSILSLVSLVRDNIYTGHTRAAADTESNVGHDLLAELELRQAHCCGAPGPASELGGEAAVSSLRFFFTARRRNATLGAEIIAGSPQSFCRWSGPELAT
jgi:hypothetical protein